MGFIIGAFVAVFVLFFLCNFIIQKITKSDTYQNRIIALAIAIAGILILTSAGPMQNEGLRSLGGSLMIYIVMGIIVDCIFVLHLDWLKSILFFIYSAVSGYIVSLVISMLLMLLGFRYAPLHLLINIIILASSPIVFSILAVKNKLPFIKLA